MAGTGDAEEERPGAPTAADEPSGEHERTARFALARFEAAVLPRLARALPARVMPDHMTALGLVASTFIAASYLLSNRNPNWLWAASAGLVVQWYGDSLDGTLARARRIERPRYGYYLDHLTDAYSTFAIALGLGLSPYMLLSVALANATVYLIMSINVYLETYVFGKFSLGYGFLGPTEARVVLIGFNTVAVVWGPLPFRLLGIDMTVFDVGGIVLGLSMFALLLRRVLGNLRTLARMEPPGVVKQ